MIKRCGGAHSTAFQDLLIAQAGHKGGPVHQNLYRHGFYNAIIARAWVKALVKPAVAADYTHAGVVY